MTRSVKDTRSTACHLSFPQSVVSFPPHSGRVLLPHLMAPKILENRVCMYVYLSVCLLFARCQCLCPRRLVSSGLCELSHGGQNHLGCSSRHSPVEVGAPPPLPAALSAGFTQPTEKPGLFHWIMGKASALALPETNPTTSGVRWRPQHWGWGSCKKAEGERRSSMQRRCTQHLVGSWRSVNRQQ